jgi:hypothetical protein
MVDEKIDMLEMVPYLQRMPCVFVVSRTKEETKR